MGCCLSWMVSGHSLPETRARGQCDPCPAPPTVPATTTIALPARRRQPCVRGRRAAGAGLRCGGVSLLTEADLHLFNEGTHHRLHDKGGAQVAEGGTWFAVWAPAAAQVDVVGDWNDWRPTLSPLRPRRGSGIWEAFVPDVGDGALYKYRITTADVVKVATLARLDTSGIEPTTQALALPTERDDNERQPLPRASALAAAPDAALEAGLFKVPRVL